MSKKNLGYPFDFIDRVLHRDQSLNRVLKTITANEWCLVHSDREGPYLAWWVLVELMAQCAGTFDEYLQNYKMKTLLIRMKSVSWKKTGRPGDQLIVEAQLVKWFENQAVYHVQATIEQETIASGDFYFGREAYQEHERSN